MRPSIHACPSSLSCHSQREGGTPGWDPAPISPSFLCLAWAVVALVGMEREGAHAGAAGGLLMCVEIIWKFLWRQEQHWGCYQVRLGLHRQRGGSRESRTQPWQSQVAAPWMLCPMGMSLLSQCPLWAQGRMLQSLLCVHTSPQSTQAVRREEPLGTLAGVTLPLTVSPSPLWCHTATDSVTLPLPRWLQPPVLHRVPEGADEDEEGPSSRALTPQVAQAPSPEIPSDPRAGSCIPSPLQPFPCPAHR